MSNMDIPADAITVEVDEWGLIEIRLGRDMSPFDSKVQGMLHDTLGNILDVDEVIRDLQNSKKYIPGVSIGHATISDVICEKNGHAS